MVTVTKDGWVRFRAYFPNALSVRVAGDFTAWEAGALLMDQEEDGWWTLDLCPTPGEHTFHYLVDDCRWETDFAAYGVELSRLGRWVSCLYVPETGVVPQAA